MKKVECTLKRGRMVTLLENVTHMRPVQI